MARILHLYERRMAVFLGIHEGPVEITVLLSQDGFTTAFEAEAELVEVPHKKNHIIRLMDEGSADRVKRKH